MNDTTKLLNAKDVADLAHVTVQTARRWMRTGKIPSHQTHAGNRLHWVTRSDDLNAALTTRTRPTIDDLTAQTGWSYHQIWHALTDAGHLNTPITKGHIIRLTDDAVSHIRTQTATRAATANHAVLVADAAHQLHMPITTIETLIRQGRLATVPSPDSTRHRYVTRTSISTYQATCANPHPIHTGDLVIGYDDARRALHATRSAMTHYVTAGTLTATTINRHIVITLTSALAYLTHHPDPTAEQGLRDHAIPKPESRR
jgi:hypothetical protein